VLLLLLLWTVKVGAEIGISFSLSFLFFFKLKMVVPRLDFSSEAVVVVGDPLGETEPVDEEGDKLVVVAAEVIGGGITGAAPLTATGGGSTEPVIFPLTLGEC
jgi:hypothetical protein